MNNTSTNIKVDLETIQSDVKWEIEDESLMNIKHEEMNTKVRDDDDNSPSVSFQKPNQKCREIEIDFKFIQNKAKQEIKDECLMNIKHDEIDINDQVPDKVRNVDDNVPNPECREPEVVFKYFQSDIKQEIEDESLVDIKQEEIDLKDEGPTLQNYRHQDLYNNVPLAIEGDFKRDIKQEIEDESLMEISQGEIDIKDDVSSIFKNDSDGNLDDNVPSVSFQKPDQTPGQKRFVCNTCGHKSARKYNLIVHIRTHTGEKPFKCSLCDYRSACKNIASHMKSHSGEKPLVCYLCNYRSAHKSNLIEHMKIHTREKEFVCNICNYRTAYKVSLRIHMRSHTGEKPFICNLCDYRTAYRNLKVHMRIHTGEKPYSCSFCDYKTTQKSHLKAHIRTHTGEKPYSCSLCDYKSTQKAHLNVHMKIHKR